MTKYYPSKKILRKMGLIKDQEGIMRRYIRESGNWDSHLTHTKKFIVKNLIDYKPKNISILGSGWLLDIPVKYLIDKCEKVFLYDIHHPAQIIHKYRHYNQLKFIEMDLTGGFIEKAFTLSQNKRCKLEKIEELFNPIEIELPHVTDQIFSVNILNQLDILLIDYLKNYVKITQDTIRRIRSYIQESHIKLLSRYKACLITDYEELHIDNDGNVIDKIPLLYTDISESQIIETWRWKFDNHYTYHTSCFTHFNVLAAKY